MRFLCSTSNIRLLSQWGKGSESSNTQRSIRSRKGEGVSGEMDRQVVILRDLNGNATSRNQALKIVHLFGIILHCDSFWKGWPCDQPARWEKMAFLSGCPRCGGTVLEDAYDGPLCVNCGWRRVDIPADIRMEVKAYLGRKAIGNRHAAKRIATGKPPLSGWERELRRRQRNAS